MLPVDEGAAHDAVGHGGGPTAASQQHLASSEGCVGLGKGSVDVGSAVGRRRRMQWAGRRQNVKGLQARGDQVVRPSVLFPYIRGTRRCK